MNTQHADDLEFASQTLAKLLAIADRLVARNVQTLQRLEAATTALDQGVSRLDAGGERFADNALRLIASNAQQCMGQGAGEALAALQEQLQKSADVARRLASALAQQRQRVRTLVWSGLIALLLGSLLAAGGAAWVAHRSMQDIAQAHFGQDLLQATHRGAITRCGDVLCMKVGKQPRRYGDTGQYVLLQE